MKIFFKSVCYTLLIYFVAGTNFAVAQENDFENWKKEFEKLALDDGIAPKTLDKYMPKMQLLQKVIENDTKKPIFLQNFWDYIEKRLSTEKIENAHQLKHTYTTWMRRVSKEYQVPYEYLLALWSMETNFGSFMGKTPLLDSLGSLAYHPRRKKFFTKELLAYFHILETEIYPPIYGSWDGGFGNFQFMPTTFLAYAVDADKNGTKSMTGSIPDSFASAANYLHKIGWKESELWGREIVLPENFDFKLIGDRKTVVKWKELGVRPIDNADFPQNEYEISAVLRVPIGWKGPAFLTYPNFALINTWNKLELYALTTGILSDIIAKRRQVPIRPKDFKPLKTEEFLRLQLILTDRGYYDGAIDGMLGPSMRKAIRMFQRDNNMITDGYPNGEILEKLGIYKKELK